MEDEFFDDDDGLDELPSHALQELESTAFQATQRPALTAEQPQPPSSDYGLEDDEEVIDLDANPRANVVTARHGAHVATPNRRPKARTQHPAQQHDEVTQREQWRVQKYGAAAQPRLPAFRPPRPASSASNVAPQLSSQQDIPPQNHPSLAQEVSFVAPQYPPNESATASDVAALQARVAELEQHHTILLQESRDAKAQAFAKAGEISIVRANQDKAVREYEDKLAVLQELHAQETAMHKAEIEAARKDREQIETSNKFLEHDLAQEADRARNARRALQGGNENARARLSPASTPKKKSSLPYRDGFNDDEVVAISPSKSKGKSRTGTPKPASKRKRPEQGNSPAKQLSFSDQDGPNLINEGTPVVTGFDLPMRPRDNQKPDGRFDFVQLVLNHRQPDSRRTVEILTQYELPSSPQQPLSSQVYDALQAARSDQDVVKYDVLFCHKILELWSRCLQEQVVKAMSLIMSLMQHVFASLGDEVTIAAVATVVPLAVQTADLVATPKARNWANSTLNDGPSEELSAFVRPLDCLELLQTIALNCSEDSDAIKSLWSCIEHDFILVMLHKAQPLAERILMLDVVGMSVLHETFGAISKTSASGEEYAIKQRQHQNEYNLISRLANLLVDRGDQQRPAQPPAPELTEYQKALRDAETKDQSRSEDETISPNQLTALDLRLASLNLLTHLCSTEHGGRLLASHRLATGRIIRLLHESILSMYNYNPRTHETATSCVNNSVMLLAHLCFVHGEVLDLRTRLAAEPGGHHKHLVALSRVAFSHGDSVIEEGIWSESAEAAHRMLDEFLSPEEGDAVVSVFSSVRSAVL